MGRNFKQIKAWQLADNLTVEIYGVTRNFPKDEIYGLVSQMRRAAVSVAANISEGAARKTKKDFLHFLNISQASLCELEYYLHLTERLGYLQPQDVELLGNMQRETAWTLHGFIKAVDGEKISHEDAKSRGCEDKKTS